MMDYNVTKKIFNSQAEHVHLDSELLNSLDYNERKVIEEKIIKACLEGDSFYYDYIKLLKIYNPLNVFTLERIHSLESSSKIELCKILYLTTNDTRYIEYLLALSVHDKGAYSMLTILYEDGVLSEKYYDRIKNICSLVKNNQEDYIKMSQRMHKKEKDSSDAIAAGLLGFAVGDALGVPIEFTGRSVLQNKPLTEMIGYGSHPVPEGTWSDDTSMTIATMDSISQKSKIDYDDIMKKYCSWLSEAKYTATGRVFDIGLGTRKALTAYKLFGAKATEAGESGIRSNGNGSLMRMLPVVYYLYYNQTDRETAFQVIDDYSSITHGHPISKLGCQIYYDYMTALLDGSSKEEAFHKLGNIDYSKHYDEETISYYKRILDGTLEQAPIDTIKSSGFVVSTLEACLWTMLKNSDYESSVVQAINLGDDTDTVGAITGSMAGVLYGKKSIPKRWLDVLSKKDYLEELSSSFEKSIEHHDRELDRMFDEESFNHDSELYKKVTEK